MAMIHDEKWYDDDTGTIELEKFLIWRQPTVDASIPVDFTIEFRDARTGNLVERWVRSGECNQCGRCCHNVNEAGDGPGAAKCPPTRQYRALDGAEAPAVSAEQSGYLISETLDAVAIERCAVNVNKPWRCFIFPYMPENPAELPDWLQCTFTWKRTI